MNLGVASLKAAYKIIIINCRTKKNVAGPFAPGMRVTSQLFVVSHDAKLLFSGGHWDNCFRIYSLAKNKPVASISGHKDIITCIGLDRCGSHLITGSRDTTCMIWEVKVNHHGISKGVEER